MFIFENEQMYGDDLKTPKKMLDQLESVSKQYKTNHLNIFDVWDAFVFQIHNITLHWKVFY